MPLFSTLHHPSGGVILVPLHGCTLAVSSYWGLVILFQSGGVPSGCSWKNRVILTHVCLSVLAPRGVKRGDTVIPQPQQGISQSHPRGGGNLPPSAWQLWSQEMV